MSTTPLLLLLDGVLSQDRNQTTVAMKQIQDMVPLRIEESPLRSAEALARVLHVLMESHPHLASVPSGRDQSLPLHFAASIGNIQVAASLLDRYPHAASTPNSKGKIPLHYAAREGRTNMVVFLLQRTPQTAQIRSTKDKLPLHFAAGDGHSDVVRALLRVHPRGASCPSGKGKLPLHFAARWGHIGVAQALLEIHPASVATLDWEGCLPLHDAAREGQLEMAKLLVERYPPSLSTANLRGEIPLFPAIRSGNVSLVVYLLQAWPRGGKDVLTTIRGEDAVEAWDETILELCLRGAVENFTGCVLFQDRTSSSLVPSWQRDYDGIHAHPDLDTTAPLATLSSLHEQNGYLRPSSPPSMNPILDINVPRCKSPILEELQDDGEKRKKRSSSSSDGVGNKRVRSGSIGEEDDFVPLKPLRIRPFVHLHAAIECGASSHVLACLLRRYPDQIQQADGLGQYPLHVAVANCRKEDEMELLLNGILKPFPHACQQRDWQGRLPLHVALMSRADGRIIQALLESNPSSGVENCGVADHRFTNKLPIYMGTEYECDLGSLYALLRGDPSVIQSWKCEPMH